jgi:mannose-1-phosphate guanylyltransferase
VENLIVVQTADALLVANRNDADQIKKLVDLLPEGLI